MHNEIESAVKAVLAQGKYIGDCQKGLRIAIEALSIFATDENPSGWFAVHAINECKKLLPEYDTKGAENEATID